MFLDLVRDADAVIEAMRPGGARASAGLGYERLREVNPRIVFCTISGYGMTGPYKDMPSHGIAYDAWAGHRRSPRSTTTASRYIPEHAVDRHQRRARCSARSACSPASSGPATTGEGCRLEIAQSDAAAAIDWLPQRDVQGLRAARVARSPATRPTTTSAARPAPRACRTACATSSTRRRDGHVLFMASEQEFWKNFCEGIGRAGPVRALARARSTPTTPGATPSCRTILRDDLPHADDRRSGSRSASSTTRRSRRSTRRRRSPTTRSSRTACRGSRASAARRRQLRYPIKFVGEELPSRPWRRRSASTPTRCSRDVLGYDDREDQGASRGQVVN